ncbi:RagB/SusD family nutrient uptake outer membrane protein [Aridibaculum aurantiacum]|uniref:RagB/SusD family nutrient uptake outer membrane protein n=1 Tax=Aridibaculum aurantiacum TaxID=2810307 RepID=UPI001A97036C|nr:RagB/SusD family nutrient uptake outer membrane protein [Aridibaculum aurantiacum]
MFKRIKYSFVALVAFIMVLQGCSRKEVLELTPEYQLDALTNPSTIDQVEQVLTGAYSRFRNANYYGSGSGTGAGWAIMPDVLSDNLYETLESLANSRAMADWIYNGNTGQITNMYAAAYQVIANANIVIRDVDKFATPSNQGRINRIKGQAFAIRALAHFDLFRYWAVDYDRNSTTSLALPYTTEFIVSSNLKPTRLSNKVYYDNLFGDIQQATTLLANVDQPINPAGRASRPFIDLTAVHALNARVSLYAGLWSQAETAATAAINARPLATGAAFAGMYTESSAGEIIWNVQVESGQSGPTYLIFFPAQQRTYFRPALEVANTSNTGLIQTNDIRYSTYFSNVGGSLAVTKYSGKGGAVDGAANFIVFRTGEMYLIRAEARARMGGQDAAALQDLNTLRAARITGYTPVTGLSGQALLDAIANERRRELIAEGHRFFDLKRTTRTIVRGSTCGNSNISPTGVCTLAPTAREWALPIPEPVRNANPNLVQNPGY